MSRGLEEEEVAAFHESKGPRYLSKPREVEQYPHKYCGWKIDVGLLYRYHWERLLDLVSDGKEGWKFVVPVGNCKKL